MRVDHAVQEHNQTIGSTDNAYQNEIDSFMWSGVAKDNQYKEIDAD
jgi:hypothetical protein